MGHLHTVSRLRSPYWTADKLQRMTDSSNKNKCFSFFFNLNLFSFFSYSCIVFLIPSRLSETGCPLRQTYLMGLERLWDEAHRLRVIFTVRLRHRALLSLRKCLRCYYLLLSWPPATSCFRDFYGLISRALAKDLN